jgi:hypothetical protein
MELRICCSRKEQTLRRNGTKVAKKAFVSLLINICGTMHELGQFVDPKGYVWTSKGEILESTKNSPILLGRG